TVESIPKSGSQKLIDDRAERSLIRNVIENRIFTAKELKDDIAKKRVLASLNHCQKSFDKKEYQILHCKEKTCTDTRSKRKNLNWCKNNSNKDPKFWDKCGKSFTEIYLYMLARCYTGYV
ncbi:MAG: hypothetical protein MHMPM18_002637, partial [Marteilia pararefringens]